MVMRSVDEIIDAALKTVTTRLNTTNKGKEKYQKRMKNKQKTKNRG
ncbi:hypothetical protein [Clostridium weizhouense]|uniref:Uncharacterized protein n=1 Tax=Clostridium weizhouense TaxID=2859781 RepID=A0ABS7AK46_9CLOT|nr:hypothetical protein [Clostridium weizhouense]MBW6409008.1 hypothetical protein [Clostridium weizhouense]